MVWSSNWTSNPVVSPQVGLGVPLGGHMLVGELEDMWTSQNRVILYESGISPSVFSPFCIHHVQWKLVLGSDKNKHWSKCMIGGVLLYLEFATATVPVLSQFTITLCPYHMGTNAAQARMIRRSSIHVMLATLSFYVSLWSSQGNCNHFASDVNKAPHPNYLDASEYTTEDTSVGLC